MQKVCCVVTAAAREDLRAHHLLSDVITHWSSIGTDAVIVVFEPRHWHARFELAEIPGVTVLPNHHDPTPIGDTVAASLAHVQAKPTETMREVALKLHAAHGHAFHPDT